MACGGVNTQLQAFCEDISCLHCGSRNEPRTPLKTLPCLHSFCEECLAAYIAGLADEAMRKKVPCPECGATQACALPEADVAVLKTNYCFENLLHHAREENETAASGGRTMHCSRCNRVAQPVDAFCTVCRLVLCDLCTSDHKAAVATANHDLILLEDMAERPVTKHKRWICPEHSDYERSLSQAAIYCQHCREVICFVCATTDPHWNHPRCTARDAYQAPGHLDRIKRSLETAGTVQEAFSMSIAGLKETKEKLAESQVAATEKIEAKTEALHRALNIEKDRVLQQVEEIYTNKTAWCNRQIEQLAIVRDKFTHSQKITNGLLQVGAPEDGLFMEEQLVSCLETLCHEHQGQEHSICTPRIDQIIHFVENARANLRIQGLIGHVSDELFIPDLENEGCFVDDHFFTNTL